MSVPRWLQPGMNIKRWLVLLLAGITLLALSADAAHPSYWRSDVVALGRQDAQGVEGE